LITVKEFEGTSTYTLYATTSYAYDSRNLLTTVTDDAGNVTTLTYDGLGRKTGMSDPDMGTWSYAYDIWGQLDTQTDARTAQIRFTYDKLGRVLTRESRPDNGTNTAWATSAEYTYDSTTSGNKGIGRLTGSTAGYVSGSPTITDSAFYNALGQVTSSARTIDGTSYTTNTTFDSNGRILSTTYPYDPDGAGSLTYETVNTTYNARGLFEGLAGTNTYVSSTTYAAPGEIDQQTLGNAVVTDFTYNSTTNRLTQLMVAKIPQNPLVDLSYTYDLGGNITQIVDASWVNGASRNETRTYGYDAINRLIWADVKNTTNQNAIEERDYAYNPIGNLTSVALNNGTPASYSYPATGNPRPHAATSKGSDSYSYDANGNMTSRVDNGVTYCQTFDTENHLVTVENLSSGDCSNKTVATTTTYVYDADGNRVKRIVNDGTTTTTTTYVAGMEIEVVGSTESKRTIYYSAGGAFRVVGGADAGLYYRHADHLNSSAVISDSSGNKVANSDVVYAPFGEIRSGALLTITDFGFTGQHVDRSTGGLMYFGARYYLPGLRRFVSADTILPDLTNPQALNRFSYVYNNPVKYSDSTGHCVDGVSTWVCVAAVVAGVAAGLAIDIVTTPPIEVERPSAPSSSDMTQWTIDRIKENADAPVTQSLKENFESGDPIKILGATKAFVSIVRTDGAWDYKQDIRAAQLESSDITLGNQKMNYQAVANITFGYLGKAAGIPGPVLEAGAGAFQLVDHIGKSPENIGPLSTYFDDPYDNWNINFGEYLYDQYGSDPSQLTTDTFEDSLNEYEDQYGIPGSPLN